MHQVASETPVRIFSNRGIINMEYTSRGIDIIMDRNSAQVRELNIVGEFLAAVAEHVAKNAQIRERGRHHLLELSPCVVIRSCVRVGALATSLGNAG